MIAVDLLLLMQYRPYFMFSFCSSDSNSSLQNDWLHCVFCVLYIVVCVPCTVYRVPCTVYHVPWTVYCEGSTGCVAQLEWQFGDGRVECLQAGWSVVCKVSAGVEFKWSGTVAVFLEKGRWCHYRARTGLGKVFGSVSPYPFLCAWQHNLHIKGVLSSFCPF